MVVSKKRNQDWYLPDTHAYSRLSGSNSWCIIYDLSIEPSYRVNDKFHSLYILGSTCNNGDTFQLFVIVNNKNLIAFKKKVGIFW